MHTPQGRYNTVSIVLTFCPLAPFRRIFFLVRAGPSSPSLRSLVSWAFICFASHALLLRFRDRVHILLLLLLLPPPPPPPRPLNFYRHTLSPLLEINSSRSSQSTPCRLISYAGENTDNSPTSCCHSSRLLRLLLHRGDTNLDPYRIAHFFLTLATLFLHHNPIANHSNGVPPS